MKRSNPALRDRGPRPPKGLPAQGLVIHRPKVPAPGPGGGAPAIEPKGKSR